ncbi:NAD(P)/FAD-dependent oxidoreductase [Chloroflexota bacterium]
MYDVIVVGGGPVGSYMAGKLAGAGQRVVVLERKGKLGEPVCCAGIIGMECAETFGADDSTVLNRVNGARLHSPSGKHISLWRERPQAVVVNRAAFDTTMADRARNKGAEYVLNTTVTDIRVSTSKAEVAATRRGTSLVMEARAVVVANGFGSRLTEQLRLGRIGDSVIGAQTEVTTSGLEAIEVYFGREVAPGFFAWLVPVAPTRALVGMMSRRSPELYMERFISSLQAQGKISSVEVKPCYRSIPLRPLPRTRGERLMVVVYYGLLCADMGADCLQPALEKDDLSARALAGYERRWKRKIGRELRIGYWARRLYEHLSDGQVDRIFDITKASGIDKTLMAAEDLSFDWHGDVVLKLLAHRVITGAIEMMKISWYNKHRI